jgi:hypothetical protein
MISANQTTIGGSTIIDARAFPVPVITKYDGNATNVVIINIVNPRPLGSLKIKAVANISTAKNKNKPINVDELKLSVARCFMAIQEMGGVVFGQQLSSFVDIYPKSIDRLDITFSTDGGATYNAAVASTTDSQIMMHNVRPEDIEVVQVSGNFSRAKIDSGA